MHRRVLSPNSVWIVYWILLSVSRSTEALLQSFSPKKVTDGNAKRDSRRFVKNNNATVFHECSGKAQQRTLPNAQVGAFTFDHCIEIESVDGSRCSGMECQTAIFPFQLFDRLLDVFIVYVYLLRCRPIVVLDQISTSKSVPQADVIVLVKGVQIGSYCA